ncbi:vacuolar protein sorting-associated protein 26C-like [Actinia tenebrosa]|uniref:Vacuolar protein sorting-associated protein 26C n=1 Tax=Actinia tenebrosa TaxID=6105 RepID=A0A6P8HEN3_ACTTE|nr:vacuolar protein sorting-associated protein 26C-like [Actinia tenebrosa]
MASLDIRLKKINKIFNEGDVVKGVIVVQSKGELNHNGIMLFMDGSVNLQLSAKSVGVLEAFYNSLKPIQLVNYSVEIAKPGKLPNGKTEIPFEIPLKPKGNRSLYETYHGVFVNVQYYLRSEMKRSLLSKDLQTQAEFIVESKETSKVNMEPVQFAITPDSLDKIEDRPKVPKFLVKGQLDTVNCNIVKPFTGELTVVESDTPIKSIELQLVRVETCGCAEGFSKDATEIQNIQIAEGDVCRKLAIPIYMTFPRLFTCPTLATPNFKVEFEVNIVIVLQDNHLITENFPIKIIRF